MASKFSVLSPSIDVDSLQRTRKYKKKKESVDNEVLPQVKKVEKNIKNNVTAKRKKSKGVSELHAPVFGIPPKGTKKNAASKKKNQDSKPKGKENRKCGPTNEMDDDWKKHDEEFVKNKNEESLREAIMLSKLEFEKKKPKEHVQPTPKQQKASKKENEPKDQIKLKKKKEKATLTITLDEFNTLKPKEIAKLRTGKGAEKKIEPIPPTPLVPQKKKTKKKAEKFFQDVDETTQMVLVKESQQEFFDACVSPVERKLKLETKEVEKRDFEIQALRLEVDSLKVDLERVKERNKKLLEIISMSDRKPKVELLVELKKVHKARDEYAHEVTKIGAELEQEKTKVSQLSQELKRLQGRKRSDSTKE